jgi:hypothetical protein
MTPDDFLQTCFPNLARLKQKRRATAENIRMKWIEIIKLRSAGEASEPLKAFLAAIAKNDHRGLTKTRVYRHALWETDWSLHLHWESEKPETNGSALGLHLSQALGEFGLVDHSLWIEQI